MNIYQKIINHYGEKKQIEKAVDELRELKNSLNEYLLSNENKDALFDVFCDVMNAMVYLQIIFNFDSASIANRMDEKLEIVIDNLCK
jgi:hypothetical protein